MAGGLGFDIHGIATSREIAYWKTHFGPNLLQRERVLSDFVCSRLIGEILNKDFRIRGTVFAGIDLPVQDKEKGSVR
jgi:hypothetical protein